MSNQPPRDYKQYDTRWAYRPYNGKGETDKTIKSSGCGPTCAAMVIASLKDKSVTPEDTCKWSVAHGYKYANQGTAYGYFAPQLAVYSIPCKQMLSSRILNKPNHEIHQQVKKLIQDGYWAIALMGTKADGKRGTWTTGGHFVLVWDWDTYVRIRDPIHASGNNKYTNGDDYTFRDECRNYWIVDARKFNGKMPVEQPAAKPVKKEDDFMTRAEILKELGDQYITTFKELPEWAKPEMRQLLDAGIVNGGTDASVDPDDINMFLSDIKTMIAAKRMCER